MIGKHYKYEGERTGKCVDVSLCKKWLLLTRDDVKEGEQDKVCVLYVDPEVQELGGNNGAG